MGPTVALKFSVAFASLCLVVKEIQCCDYEFANLNSSLSVDWSASIGSVIYTVQVTKLSKNVSTTDVLLQIDPPSSEFKFNESNIYQVLVETCLEHGTTYEVKIKIVNDSNCDPGVLTLTTVFATPQFNMETTAFTVIPDENPFKPFTEAFVIKIPNDRVFGGCGSFTCTSHCDNDANQEYAVDEDTKLLSARWSVITIGFVYNLEVTCLDVFDSSLTDEHSFKANLTFVLTMPTSAITSTTATIKPITPEPTTMTTFKSTSIKASTHKSTSFKAPVSTIRQTSTTIITSTSLKLDTSKATISAIMSKPTTSTLPVSDFSAAASYPQSTVDRASKFSTLGSISTVKSSISELTETLTSTPFQHSSNTSSSSSSSDTISPVGVTISGSVLTTLSGSQQVYTGFFNKPKNIVTVLLPAVAFSGLAVFGIIYVIYKKVMKKASITPVIGL